MPTETPILHLATIAQWKTWLIQNSASSSAILLTTIRTSKNVSLLSTSITPEEATTITYAAALDEALCHGWIDSGGRGHTSTTKLTRFGPRKFHSLWSLRNVQHIIRLDDEGRLHPAGLAAIETAKANGRWETAYSAGQDPPPAFFAALEENATARETWEGLSKGNRWQIYFRLLNLKTEKGRERRIKAFVEMLGRGETVVSQQEKKKGTRQGKRGGKVSIQPTEQQGLRQSMRCTRSGRPVPFYAP